MAIPDYQTVMLPLLKYLSDNQEHTLRETIDALGNEFNLTNKERKQLLPSGQQEIFNNRVGWARTYLKKAGLIESIKRGIFKITDRGKQVLESKPTELNVKYLERFPEFIEFRTRRKKEIQDDFEITVKSPEELLETSYQNLREELTEEILEHIRACSPAFFEKLVIELLVKMGYGGSRKDAAERIGKSGDEGIDGIIKEDKLGLDTIFIQAKKWENTVSRPEIQKFVGALQGQRAKKGIFITTSDFSREAIDYVGKIDSKVVLIDGDKLANFMIDHNLGVSTTSFYEIKRIDSDYFQED